MILLPISEPSDPPAPVMALRNAIKKRPALAGPSKHLILLEPTVGLEPTTC